MYAFSIHNLNRIKSVFDFNQKHFMKRILVIFICLYFVFSVIAQRQKKRNFKIMCYNVENFFDCIHDSLSEDTEFLPTGIRGWNFTKYQKKQAAIAKVITAIGGWDAPALVGICEVESEKCLYDLTHFSGLKNLRYNYLHHDSPDPRGIDVALLFQPDQFKPIFNKAIRIRIPGFPESRTRDILFVSGLIPTGDTLHIFVCHLPSRLEGENESEGKRKYVASVIREKVDSLYAKTHRPKIVIMGDFNDYPTNSSLTEVLKANPVSASVSEKKLYNLMYKMQSDGKGTNKHLGEWGVLDQLIISGNLLDSTGTFYTSQQDAHVFDAEFLLENDLNYLGKKPLRTYVGMKYHDGFSDHLPVYTDFWY